MITEVKSVKEVIARGAEVCNPSRVAVSEEALEGVKSGAKFAQQGDIYVRKLDAVPKGYIKSENHDGQLAPGTTRGSRHCVDPNKVDIYVRQEAPRGEAVLEGPVLYAEERFDIMHPEHGWVSIPGLQFYQITYQRAFADEIRRVMD